MNGFIKIGHRGACGYEPENTLASFEYAIKLRVDMIEFDVMQCKTGEIVVIHDDTVDRTTNGHGFVKDLTLKELRKLDAGDEQQIPTLQEVLELVKRKCKVNIELKGTSIAQKVADIIQDYIKTKNWLHSDFLVSSFDFVELKKFKEVCSHVAVSLLFYEPEDYIKIAQAYNANFIGLDMSLVTKDVLDAAHQNNIKVLVYTVNDLLEIKNLKDLGVDGIFSDYPDRLT